MKKSQLETLIREVIRETIRKVDGKYVVYPEKGGKRLGTHSSKAAAEKQLTAIHLNKEAVEIKYTNPNFDAEWQEAVRYPEFNNMGKESWIRTARVGQPVSYSSIKDVLGNVDLNFEDLEEPKKQRFQAAFQKGIIEMPIAVKFSDDDYDLVAGNTRLSGLVKNGIDPKIWIVDISDLQENYADGKVNESGYEEAWELLGQPVPEIQTFVKQLGLKNDDATAKKIGTIIDNIKDTSLTANKIPGLKNLANKGNDAKILKAIKQISGKPDAEQQYVKLMQARDAGEKRNRGYDVGDLIKKVKSGNYEPPVLLQLPSGLYVIGGRTRLYAALALGIQAKVKIISRNTFKQVKENYADGKGNKNTLEYLNSITKEAPFNPPQYLYHLCAPENIDSILKTGLKPGKPEASLHGGKIKGEEFSGVWLTPIDDVDEIVDTHFLPEEFYNGEILQIDTSGLNKDRFSIGIEYNLMKPPFTKQEYLDKTEEIIYLDAIPPSAISTLQENYADGKVKGKSRPGRVKKAGASCKGSVTDLRAKAKKYSGEKGKMYHWCANMKCGKKK